MIIHDMTILKSSAFDTLFVETKVTRCFGTPVGFSLGGGWTQWPGGPSVTFFLIDFRFLYLFWMFAHFFCVGSLWLHTFLVPASHHCRGMIHLAFLVQGVVCWHVPRFFSLRDSFGSTPWGAYKGAENVALGPAGWRSRPYSIAKSNFLEVP